jgi:hypothetical protein
MQEATIQEATMQKATMQEATMQEATMQEATMQEAAMQEATMQEATMQEAAMQEAYDAGGLRCGRPTMRQTQNVKSLGCGTHTENNTKLNSRHFQIIGYH